MESFVEQLSGALEGAVERAAPAGEFGVLFSAGLDSSLLAWICRRRDLDALLFSAALPGSLDARRLEAAQGWTGPGRLRRPSPRSSGPWGMEMEVARLDPSSLEGRLRRLVGLLGSSEPMGVSIALAFDAALELAARRGVKVVLSGQGSDELFAGYHRYLNLSGAPLESALRKDWEKLHRVDLPRDRRVAEARGVELLFPYCDPGFAETAWSVPVEWKLRDGERKWILRRVAESVGLPSEVVAGAKKAAQYSSGTRRAITRLARARGMFPGEYLESLG